MFNTITYGLEKLYIALKGVAQQKSIEVTAGCSLDGEMTVTVTGAPLTDGSEAVKVPVSTESHGTVSQVASAVCNVLNNNADFLAHYRASCAAGVIYIRALVVAAADNTLDIAFTVGSTGVTVGSSADVAAGATGWGVPRSLPGAVAFNPKPEGKELRKYGDNGVYYSATSNNGYTAELEVYDFPLDLLAEILTWITDDNGVILEDAAAAASTKEFALLGQFNGDVANRRWVYYNCSISRPSKDHKTTEEDIDPQTDKMPLIIVPETFTEGVFNKAVKEYSVATAAVYNSWFDSVYQPVIS